jgi:hypothetical protein
MLFDETQTTIFASRSLVNSNGAVRKERSLREASAVLKCGMTFFEVIEHLIDAGDLQLEEHERVPSNERDRPQYKEARDVIHSEFANFEAVEAACYHESSHFVYATLLAFELGKDPTTFRVVGPTIKYHPLADTASEKYEPTPTALKAPGLPLPNNSKSLEETARIAVAGGESIRWFRPGHNLGNRNDFRRFKQLRESAFRLTHPVLRHTIKSTKHYWKGAAWTVQDDFRIKRHNQLIEAEAQLIMREIFGSVFLHSSTKEIR